MDRAKGFKIIKLMIILILSVVIFGCSGQKKEDVKRIQVAYWGSYQEVKIIRSIIEDWQKEHPDIIVELQHTPGVSNYTNKLLTRVAGGNPPDVAFAEVAIFVDFQKENLFMDLNPFIENDPDFSLEDYFPDVVKRFTRDGKIYGIPRDTAPFACVYYNKRLFDEAGVPYPTDDWTWSDLLEKSKALTKKNKEGQTIVYGFYSSFYQNFIYSNGGKLVDNVEHPARCMLDDPKTIEGLQFYADLFTKYGVSPDPIDISNIGLGGGNELFMRGRIAMYNSGIWETPMFRNIKDFDWDVVMFPKGPTGVRGFGTGGSAYCIMKSTKYPEASWQVVKALAADKGQIMMAEEGLAQPANRKIAEGPHWAGSPKKPLNKGMLNKAVRYVIYSPFHSKWREIEEKYLSPELDYLLLGEETAEEFAHKLTPIINKMLQKKED